MHRLIRPSSKSQYHAVRFDVVERQKTGDLVLRDADDTLSTFMKNGIPDAGAFRNGMGEILEQVRGEHPNRAIRIYGQMVDLLWKRGRQEDAIRLEVLWNELADSHLFSLLCGYGVGSFYKAVGLDAVCRQHTHVLSADGLPDDKLDPVS